MMLHTALAAINWLALAQSDSCTVRKYTAGSVGHFECSNKTVVKSCTPDYPIPSLEFQAQRLCEPECNAGEYSQKTSCHQCPANSWNPKKGFYLRMGIQNTLTKVGEKSYSCYGGDGFCCKCNATYFSPPGSTNITQCCKVDGPEYFDNGTLRSPAFFECLPENLKRVCPETSPLADLASGKCLPVCPAGQYSQNEKCTQCPKGQYSPTRGMHNGFDTKYFTEKIGDTTHQCDRSDMCCQCPKGTTSPPASTSYANCQPPSPPESSKPTPAIVYASVAAGSVAVMGIGAWIAHALSATASYSPVLNF